MNDLISRKALLEDIKNQYSLSYGEILIDPRDIYDMVDNQKVAIKGERIDNWIPVSERLPECEEEVLILTERNKITTAMYEDGKMPEDDSIWSWYEVDFSYDEDNDIYCVPEGWLEYRHFNPDDEYNNTVDEKVIAWQPLPEPWKGDKGIEN